jgi:hypothetical protein
MHGTFLRILAGVAIFAFAGCSSFGAPPNVASSNVGQSSSAPAKSHQPDPACPTGGIVLSEGTNGPYSVAVGDNCQLLGPPNQVCIQGSQAGETFVFVFQSGDSNGTLSGTAQSGGHSVATFTRSSSGQVVVKLDVILYQNPGTCKTGGGFTYGTVTLTT